MEIVKYLEGSGLLIKGASETIKNVAVQKVQKGGFFNKLLGSLGASSLGNLLVGKFVIQAGEETTTVGASDP